MGRRQRWVDTALGTGSLHAYFLWEWGICRQAVRADHLWPFLRASFCGAWICIHAESPPSSEAKSGTIPSYRLAETVLKHCLSCRLTWLAAEPAKLVAASGPVLLTAQCLVPWCFIHWGQASELKAQSMAPSLLFPASAALDLDGIPSVLTVCQGWGFLAWELSSKRQRIESEGAMVLSSFCEWVIQSLTHLNSGGVG